LAQSLDQACAFELVVGEFPAATVAVGLEKTRIYPSLQFRPSESGEFAKFGRSHRKSHRRTARFASEGVRAKRISREPAQSRGWQVFYGTTLRSKTEVFGMGRIPDDSILTSRT